MLRRGIDYEVKRTGTGLGLFALRPIGKGARILEYTGPLVSEEYVDRSNKKYFFSVNSKWSIDGSERSNMARYINHSCRPNAEPFVTNRRVWIWSRRKIKAGEEITYDYGNDYFEWFIRPIGCRCSHCKSKRRRRGKSDRGKQPAGRTPRETKVTSLSDSSLRGRGRAARDVPAP